MQVSSFVLLCDDGHDDDGYDGYDDDHRNDSV